MPTGARGEAFVEVDGQQLPVLLTNRALMEVEKLTGKTILEIVQANGFGMAEVAQLLRAGLEYGRREARAGGRQYVLDDAWKIIDELGFAAVAKLMLEAVTAVLTFRPDSNHETHEKHEQEQDPNG